MSVSDGFFYVVALAVIAAAAGVAFSKNILHSALALLGALVGVGALFVFLNADFLAVTQLLIYIGGVLVLILFAVMLTQRIEVGTESNPSRGVVPGSILLVLLLVGLGAITWLTPWGGDGRGAMDTTVERLGELLLGHDLVLFEVMSLLLLGTLVGAVVVAKKEKAA